MGLLPEIEDGKLQDPTWSTHTPYTPPKYYSNKKEDRQQEFNNLGRKLLSEDFSDSNALNV